MNRVKVVAVTPVHNRRVDTVRCLQSIFRSHLDTIDLHIIVVDDGSTDGTAEEVTERFPDVEILHGDGNLWYSGGMNLGFARALELNPDYILGFNDDSIFDDRCVLNLVKCAEQNQRSVVGALLLNWQTPHKVFQVAPRWKTWRGGFIHWRHQTAWTVPVQPFVADLIVGNCVLYPTGAIKESGLMDERRFPQYGDAEYTPRMKRNGWQLLIEPRARIFCKPNTAIEGFRRMSFIRQFKELFLNKTGPYSIKRRFNAAYYGAPTKLQGLTAFFVFFIRVIAGLNVEGRMGETLKEEPMTKVYRSRIVADKY